MWKVFDRRRCAINTYKKERVAVINAQIVALMKALMNHQDGPKCQIISTFSLDHSFFFCFGFSLKSDCRNSNLTKIPRLRIQIVSSVFCSICFVLCLQTHFAKLLSRFVNSKLDYSAGKVETLHKLLVSSCNVYLLSK